MNMIAAALFAGFFSAIGWWGGNRVTSMIDPAAVPTPKPAIADKYKHEKPTVDRDADAGADSMR